jgi:Uma2 family endonuclease
MIARAQRLFASEEYLSLERNSSFKSEYLAGKIYAMAGASPEHNIITANVVGEFYSQLKVRPCRTYPSDMRVKVDATGLYTYPDVTVVCGEPQYADEHGDILLNPTVIVEVLSPSTEAYDRGEKFEHYRRIASLTDYVLIAQDRMWAEHYVRQGDSQWLLSEASTLEHSIHLASIGCTLSLVDIYDKVSLPTIEGSMPHSNDHISFDTQSR